jgi:uncharacterized membrane protein SpoIIM required for sporulation
MNVERWVAKRRPVWQQLEDLLRQIESRGIRTLDRQQLQDLGRLYRSASADLSRARAMNLGTAILSYVNNLVVKAHNQVYQRRKNRFVDLLNFFYATFPELVRQNIIYIAASFLVFMGGVMTCYDYTRQDVNFAHMELVQGHPLVSDDMWDLIEKGKMWTDQLQDASPAFASAISTNNIRVCLLSFVLGITGGLGTLFVLFYNGMSIGTVFGICEHFGLRQNILLFVVGHGSLELPAIFISGGAGLLLGKGMLFPGDLPRADSIRLAARSAVGLFLGCIPILLIAGAVEGFISPRTDLDGRFKVIVGACLFIALLVYLFVPRAPLGSKKPVTHT